MWEKIKREFKMMKTLALCTTYSYVRCWKEIAKWMLRAYIVWSICADIFLIGGILYLIFF
ncbi:hypothetical protein CMI47_16150 [Candidatus Pacearchaeota archaeon]|nr:hypothetical protein [Candidatus Pacearchaeota archaeon]MAG27071.1 hypothetical protein [Candidatus Pacearchaeota archaeon]